LEARVKKALQRDLSQFVIAEVSERRECCRTNGSAANWRSKRLGQGVLALIITPRARVTYCMLFEGNKM
jgi:hypothetical protein